MWFRESSPSSRKIPPLFAGQRIIQARNQQKQIAKVKTVPPKYEASSELNVTTQKTVFFMVTSVRNYNPA
jgi:hypothetical protein